MQIYLVGGAIRDRLLNLAVSERDWLVVGATPAQMLALGYVRVGKDFPVFLHPQTNEEYALARTERKIAKGHTGFSCDTGAQVTLEQDLSRRDLTINAIAQDQHGAVIDPYGGCADLNNKILRHVSHAFSEDPLRILRLARFSAKLEHLGFKVAPATQQLVEQMLAEQADELNSLPGERIWQETHKALITNSPWAYFTLLHQCGALTLLMQPLAALWISEKHSAVIQLLQNVSQQSDNPVDRFAALSMYLNTTQINDLSDTIKVPNKYRQFALKVSSCVSYLSTHQLDAQGILELIRSNDAIRNNVVFHQAIALIKLVHTQIAIEKAVLSLLEDTLDAIVSIDNSWIKQGSYSTSFIKQTIYAKQLQLVRQLVKRHVK
jgi:tRNA nucleotidyltransferase (CCA-adding enzyme)